ncbi:long-chain-fatty-acid--CoA ligase [Neobacillus vireti]|uniref:Long-chain-fatty-acid--CoA ligase n=1 Tax=Neobacillus vireti LMG 21834 TaxID=1131730 RepID=A0AB94IFY7_9BACI|nr:long-chain fatty acid--CoA ligase [Neobacillus vireti]ETI66025.1 long-chain-fatty-acid--CoA ligase [Neobacillus vireti LMG 21834]KLT19310.1 AMP-dependent synthetase [Neobacillus vireti]
MDYQKKPWLKFYDPRISADVSNEYDSLFDLLKQAANIHNEKPALTFFGRSWSYKETRMISEWLAASLYRVGFKKGDRMAIMLPNCPHYIFSLFASFRLGGVAVQVNPMYVEREIEYVLNDSEAEYMVVFEALYPRVKQVQPRTSLKKVIVVGFGGNKVELADGDLYFEDFLTHDNLIPEIPIDINEDVAILQYTGGTTGVSKGVMLTHHNLLANIIQVCDFTYNAVEEKPENFKIVSVLPMFHVYGLSCNALSGIRIGGNQLILPRFDVKEVLELIKREKPFQMTAVPTMIFALNSHPDLEDSNIADIYYLSSGGAPLPVEQVKSFEKRVGKQLADGYGLSETAPSAISTPPFLPRKLGSVGIPLPGTEARIVTETAEGIVDVPVGEAGELILRGPQVMKGYWKRPGDTEMVLKEGWLFTGDIAKMDEDGYFYILDRKKDIIIASGYNVYPREIEEVLYQHDGVEEAIVVGIPDTYRGETVKAFVKVKAGISITPDKLIAFAKINLAPYKVPREIEILDDLPKSSVGKLLRRMLRNEEEKVKA